MSEHHPTAFVGAVKPGQSYPAIPLCPHTIRRWAKKIRGRMRYFRTAG